MVRVHFDSHHSGLGGGSDMASFVAFGSILALEIIDRSRTSPFHSAALFLIALVMHQPDLLRVRTLAIQIAMFCYQHRVNHIFVQCAGGHIQLIGIQIDFVPQIASVDDRQNIRFEQLFSKFVVVKPAVGNKALAPIRQI